MGVGTLEKGEMTLRIKDDNLEETVSSDTDADV